MMTTDTDDDDMMVRIKIWLVELDSKQASLMTRKWIRFHLISQKMFLLVREQAGMHVKCHNHFPIKLFDVSVYLSITRHA